MQAWLQTVWTIVRKEFRGIMNEPRMVVTIVLIPFLICPVILTGAQFALKQNVREGAAKVGMTEAFQSYVYLLDGLEDIQLTETDKPLDTALKDHDIDLYLDADENGMNLVYNSTSITSMTHSARIAQAVIDRCEKDQLDALLVQYSLERPSDWKTQWIELIDLYKSNEIGMTIIMLIPMLLLTYCSHGVSAVAGELTVAERERGTLDPLLATGVSPEALLTGKSLVCISTGFLSCASTFIGLLIYAQVRHLTVVNISVQMISVIFFLCLTLSLVYTGTAILIGTVSRSFKENSAFSLVLSMFSMMISFFAASAESGRTSAEYYLTPLLGQACAIRDAVTGNISFLSVGLTALSTAVLYCLLRFFSSRVMAKRIAA